MPEVINRGGFTVISIELKRFWPFCSAIVVFLTLLIRQDATAKNDGDEIFVPRWAPFDFTFTSSASPENPFLVPLEADATGPDGQSFSIPGFYNGDNQWVIRFSANREGRWEIVTRSRLEDLNKKQVEFHCVPNENPHIHGGLRVDPKSPHHFVFEDGARYFLLGYECDWLWALDAGAPDLPTLTPFLDKLRDHGFNHIILNAYAHDTSWRKGKTEPADFGPPPLYAWNGSNDKPDHRRFDLEYWKHYDSVIRALHKRGIIAHIMIKVYNKKVKWPKRGSREDDLFFRWVVARYAAYPNVVWDFSKESYNEKDQEYKKNRLGFLREWDPYDRLITLHDDKDYATGAYDELADFHSDQNHKDWHEKILSQRKRRDWPIVNVEFGYEQGPKGEEDKTYRIVQPPEEVCRRAWLVCMAGGYPVYYYTYTAWDVIRPEDTPDGYQLMKNLRQFFERGRYWELEPRNDLVSRGYCLADPGKEYIVYMDRSAESTLTMNDSGRSYRGVWFHPHTGKEKEMGVVRGGEKLQLAPPQEWLDGPCALHLVATSRGAD